MATKTSTELQQTQLLALVETAPIAQVLRGWNELGGWAIVVDADAARVAVGNGSSVWHTCDRAGAGFGARASATLRAALQEFADQPALRQRAAQPAELPGGVLIAAPIRRRDRLLGVCAVVLGAPGEPADEDWRRFCDQCGVDAQAAAQQRSRAARFDAASQAGLAALLAQNVDAAVSAGEAQREITGLTRNLESTYEELSLVYRVNGEITSAHEPADVLKRVASETVASSRAAAIAFVLPRRFAPESLSTGGGTDSDGVESDVCVARVGAADVSDEDIARLALTLMADDRGDRDVRVFNNVGSDNRFAFARPWLRHALVLPMRHRQRRLGMLLAINCRDAGDFSSVDAQLLRAVADRVQSFLERQRLYDDLARLLMGLMHSLVKAIDAKDPYTCGHSERVAFLSRRLAETIGMDPHEAQRVYLAGLLHDVGKIGVPDAILLKPGKLTAEEFAALKLHPEMGAKILAGVPHIDDLIPGVMSHHERYDGRGYPQGLSGAHIPWLGRVVCLADCLDAMTTTRTYRSYLPVGSAMAEIRRCAGTQFDPRMAAALLDLDVGRLLHDAHEFAGSVLPEHAGAPTSEPRGDSSFGARPIFNRQMFVARVTAW
ncbi:MAG: HD domain-containing protein [Phycisphaerae bacterium]